MRKANNKTLALLHDHVLRLSENIAPTLTGTLDEPEGVLREIIETTQDDFCEAVFNHRRFWTFLPHAGLVRVEQILPSGIICCFGVNNVVSNTSASDMASNDFPLWVMDRRESDMISNILLFNEFERDGLTFKTYMNNFLHISLVDPVKTDQLWLLITINEKYGVGSADRKYAIRWSTVLNNRAAFDKSTGVDKDSLISNMNRFLFNDSDILTVTNADIIRVYTSVSIECWLDNPDR